jgi:membrane protein DedA with SNARE-associated domain
MLDTFLDWLAALPGAALYGILGIVAAVENIFPPFPADTVVAFGGYLAARADRTILNVFLAVWIGNVAGAMVMYALGRRFGADRLVAHMGGGDASGAHDRLATLYGTYGTAAIFISRFLPGVRGFVPPLLGAARVPAPRTAIVIALASGVWYGAICYLAARIGNNWEALQAAVKESGRWIGIIAVTIAAGGVVAWLVRRRRA